jgi:hypothetical protein
MSYPSAPEHTPFGQRLRDRTQPLAPDDEAYGFAHAYLCEALSKPFLQVQEIFDPEGDVPPVAPLLNPDLCPDFALSWLGQLVGVTIPAGTAPDIARAIIRDVAGFRRGTRAAILAGVSATLTGTKTIFIRERDTSAYTLEIVTLAGETPDPALTQAAILAVKPAGIVLSYRTVASWDYEQMVIEFEGRTYAAVGEDYSTYRRLREHTLG